MTTYTYQDGTREVMFKSGKFLIAWGGGFFNLRIGGFSVTYNPESGRK